MNDLQKACPLCGATVPVTKLDPERKLFEYDAHGGCGHFIATYYAAVRIADTAAEARDRTRCFVIAQNEKRIIPRLESVTLADPLA